MSDGPTEDDILSHSQNRGESAKRHFDVFLCYDRESDEDRRSVKKIGSWLKAKEIVPWFDEWEVRPGTPLLPAVEEQIENIKAAAVFVGQSGIGSWQTLTIGPLLREFVGRGCPVIPILLPEAPSKPNLPVFLRGMTWVDFRILKQDPNPVPDEDPFNRLIFGITGRKPWEEQVANEIQPITHVPVYKMEIRINSHVLITSLGASPTVISAIYDSLTKNEGLTINRVAVLRSASEAGVHAHELIREALADRCKLDSEVLDLEDTNGWTNAWLFLKKLCALLNACQTGGDTVYLSLAGGSQSMATLMASVAPAFSCVKHLYHVINPDEERLLLIDIPFEPRQQINQQIISRLLTATEDELTRMEYDQEIATLLGLSIKPAYDPPVVLPGAQIDSVLIVPLGKTLITATQFYTLLQHQENRKIHQVVLVYPAQAIEVAREAKLIRKALREEDNVPCTLDHISGLEEVDSLEVCRRYQAELEAVIDRARHVYPDYRIDLAFSQVEENLVAMIIFAAQKKQLPYVYHTLITDKQLGEAIDQQTTIEALDNLGREKRNDRLFLRAYEEEGVYTKFVLFKLPVFSPWT